MASYLAMTRVNNKRAASGRCLYNKTIEKSKKGLLFRDSPFCMVEAWCYSALTLPFALATTSSSMFFGAGA